MFNERYFNAKSIVVFMHAYIIAANFRVIYFSNEGSEPYRYLALAQRSIANHCFSNVGIANSITEGGIANRVFRF